MSKLKDVIDELTDTGAQIPVIVPGLGMITVVVEGREDDVIRVDPVDDTVPRFEMHFTQFIRAVRQDAD